MTEKKNNIVILILSHVYNKHVKKLFDQIKNQCRDKYDINFLCDNSRGIFDDIPKNDDFFLFTVSDLDALGYPRDTSVAYAATEKQDNPYHQDFNFVPGNTILPPMTFFRRFPDYDHYWIVEYDVRFSSDWSGFFGHFATSDADLLGTTLLRHEQTPNWYHWPSLDLKDDAADTAQWLRGFFPVYRLSRRAFAQLDQDLHRGNKGHYECLVPTLLHQAGMRIEDIGGDGEFVQPHNINRFYRNTPAVGSLAPGTFVFRPAMQRAGAEPGKLWHPVKPQPPLQHSRALAGTFLSKVARRLTNNSRRNGA